VDQLASLCGVFGQKESHSFCSDRATRISLVDEFMCMSMPNPTTLHAVDGAELSLYSKVEGCTVNDLLTITGANPMRVKVLTSPYCCPTAMGMPCY